MRKLILLFFLSFFIAGAYAQNANDIRLAKSVLNEQAEQLGLEKDQIEKFKVSDHYVSKLSQATHLYLWQTHDGVPVYNGIITIGIKNGEIYNLNSNAVENISSILQKNQLKLNAEEAIKAAGEQLGFPNSEEFVKLRDKGEQSFVYAPTSFAYNEIPVFLCYDKNEKGNYALAWNVDLDIPGGDYWSVRVDAATGKIINKNNYTVSCQFENLPTHTHNNQCSSTSKSNSEKKTTNKTNEFLVNSMMNSESSTYRVYPLPAESPIHGEHELVESPYDPIASPFGWHDTDGNEGAEYTITRGNNVYAYLDKDDDNNSDGGEPDGGSNLVFDFAHAQNLEPEDSEDAAQVNLFYMNNMMHDFTYRYGFDEAAGNFQANNYENGGNSGDHVEAQSADGSGTNNANFSTPPDGSSGRMQMFLWGGSEFDLLTVNEPSQIAGKYEVRQAGYGPPVSNTPVSGNLVIVDDGSSEPTRGCNSIINQEAISGNIAVIDRGLCDFSAKTYNAQEAGAIAVIVCNIAGVNGGNGSEIIAMGAGDNANLVTIPSIMATLQDCNEIRASIEAGVQVTATLQLPQVTGPMLLDASYDNGVIAHEYGHGISNRLTGGPSQAGCLVNDEQMGEGWSDFFALVTTVEPGDVGTDARGIGNFVNSENVNGGGIRDFPYSTDIDVSPKTYDDIIGTTFPHPLGEVWAAATWDLYWEMVDLYGYDADINNLESGNARAIRLVMDGMKEQGCSPGFASGRDGILLADIVNFDGAHQCLIWKVFARRGIGFNSDQGSTSDRNDNRQGFDLPPDCLDELRLIKTASSIVEAGNQFEITLNAINYRKFSGEGGSTSGVVITDEIPEGAEYVEGSASLDPIVDGNMLIFEVGEMGPEAEIEITYNLLATSDGESVTYYFDNMEEDAIDNWDIAINEGSSAFWELSDIAVNSGEEAWWIPNSEEETDNEVFTIDYIEITGERPTLKFFHQYNTETGSDGGFVAVQEEGQQNWTRLNFDNNIRNGFNVELAYTTFAIPSLASFSGSTEGEFIDTYLDLSEYIGKKLKFQFRFGTDEMAAATGAFSGWAIDDFEIIDLKDFTGNACIKDNTGNGNCANALTIASSSGVVNTQNIEPDDFEMKVYPNPASDMVNIKLTSKKRESATLTLYSVDGTLVYNSSIELSQGNEIIQLPVNNLSKGFYFIQLKGSTNTSIKRLVIE